MRFRKKPVVVEALLWDGKTIDPMIEFLHSGAPLPKAPDDPHVETGIGFVPALGEIYIPTLEGTMTAKPGDWIIRGVAGEFYPCKPEIFEQMYEPTESATTGEEDARTRKLWADVAGSGYVRRK
jgi:hypothetical protein